MIRTDHPIALGVTLVLLLVLVLVLDPGLAAALGLPTGDAEPSSETGAPSGVTSSNLTDGDGRIIAERLYDGTPDRIEEKRGELQRAREIRNPTGFINTDGVNISQYVGEKVVLIEFWTFGCYNCRNTHPYIKDYWREYEDDGLVVIGVHYPEFDYEEKPENVREYVNETNTTYPVVLDNEGGTWNAYDQRYWPTRYLIGVDGFIRHRNIGEGGYEGTEQRIRELLAERDRVLNRTADAGG